MISPSKALIDEYTTADGFKFSLIHFESERYHNDDVIIYIHGNGSSHALRDVKKINTLSSIFLANNIDFIVPNNRGSNYIEQHKRIDKNEESKVFTGMTYEQIKDSQYDIEAIISYALEKGYKNIYMMGLSTGANKIAVYNNYKTKKTAELKGYIFVSGGDDIGLRQRVLGNRLKRSLAIIQNHINDGRGSDLVDTDVYPTKHPLSYQSLLEMLQDGSDYDVFNYHSATFKDSAFKILRKIQLPSLYIYGSKDNSLCMDVKSAVSHLKQSLSKQINEIVVIPGADHNFRGHDTILAKEIIKWIKRNK